MSVDELYETTVCETMRKCCEGSERAVKRKGREETISMLRGKEILNKVMEEKETGLNKGNENWVRTCRGVNLVAGRI